MAQQSIIGARGVWTSPNLLSDRPEATLLDATDFIIRYGGTLQLRPGYAVLVGGPWADGSPDRLTVYNGYPVFHSSSTNKLGYHNTSTYVTYGGTYSKISSTAKVRFCRAAKNLYFTTSTGVYRLDDIDGTPVAAGVAPPLSIETASGGATAGWLTDPGTVAYRAVMKFKDANGNWHNSAPCGRGIYRNSGGGTLAVSVTVRFVASLSTSYWLQVYRSKQTVSATDEPSDEMGLVYEAALTSTNVSNKYVTITDQVPDVMRGASGYFSPSQEGIGQANYPPPLARDIVLFRNCLFFARTTSKHRITLRLLVVGSPNGIQDADTITIAGTVYTAKTTPTTDQHFALVTSGSAQTNVQGTALNLVKAINTAAANTLVYAYYISGADDAAGIVAIEERAIGGSSYALISSRAACWVPQLPTSGTTVSSDNDNRPARVYVSKPSQMEAVPLLQYFDVGAAEMEIHRVAALRDSLFIFKQDGIFRLTGESPESFRVTLLDPTVRVTAPDTVSAADNRVFALTDRGVVAVSDSGAQIVSRPIDVDLWSAIGANNAGNWGAGHDGRGQYFLCLVDGDGNSKLWAYNTGSDLWTNDSRLPLSGAASSTNGSWYWGFGNYVWAERLGDEFTAGNYRDNTSAISGTLTWNIATGGMANVLKHFREIALHLYRPLAQTITVGFKTDITTTEQTVSVAISGDGSTKNAIVRVPIPQSLQRGNHLIVRVAVSTVSTWFFLEGVSLVHEPARERTTR